MEEVPSEEMSRIKPITSQELKKLFNSLKVDYPDASLCESFVRQIIQDDMLRKLVTAVKSLSKEIVLSKYIPTRRRFMPTVEACVLEVDVVYDEHKHFVIIKDASSNAFFNVNEDYLTRVILIKSKCVPKDDAKLTVFSNFKHVINKRQPVIILQHENDEFDDVAKFIAYQMLSQFCTFIESVINAFTIDLPKIISDYPEKLLTVEKIHHLCLEVFERIEDEAILSLESKRDWKRLVADKIQDNIRTKGEPICADIWVKINKICQKTVQDLIAISRELEGYQAHVLPIDQNKQMKELMVEKFTIDYIFEKLAPRFISKCIPGDRDYIHGAMDGGSGSNKQPNIGQTKISENVEARAVDEASSIKKELDSGQTEIIKAEAKEEGSSIKKDLDSGQTKIMDTAVTSGEMSRFEPEMSSFKPITSEQLKNLFSSFKVKYPDDPLNESFVHQIIQDGMLRNLVTAVKSLSKGIDLSKKLHTRKHDMPTVKACVFEVDVVYDRDQFRVTRKDASSNVFFIENEDDLTRVILIKSKSLPVIDAKLMVYKIYKHVILKRRIILQHEYEDIDDVAKCVAYQILSSFCCFVESVRNAFIIDLRKIIYDYPEKFLHVEKIKRLCLEAFENIADEAVVPLERKREWKQWIADEIKRNILTEGDPLCPDAWTKIRNICRKTVQDLTAILKELGEFKNKVLPVDQNKQIEEWLKREVVLDISVLQKHPSIIKYITGYRDSNDKKQVVKVYIHGEDKEAERVFKNCCGVSKNTQFEFENVEKSKEKNDEKVEQLKQRERKAPAIDNSIRKQLKKIIQEHGDTIYARHSSVIGIRIGKARRVGDTIQEQPCLVLYCLDKFLIPFGEKHLPEAIAGWPCDIREDFVRFGGCPNRCPASEQSLPDPGCSIGIPSNDSSGSVGFLVEPKNPLHTFEFGFLTASHVAIKRFEQLYHDEKLFSMHFLKLNNHFIVHPSWIDNGRIDRIVGKVVESFCGNYGLEKVGLDFAVIASRYCRNGAGKETLTVATEDDLDFEANMVVTKTGRTTGTTYGYLKDDSLTVKIDRSFLSRGYLAFFNCYAIEDKTDIQPFFGKGDSGSGVYVMEKGKPAKPLGIAFAYLDSQTAVCNIGMIVDKLDLQIVRYLENKDSLKMFEELKISNEKTEEKSQEPMEES